jgi:hypothetical protein
LKLGPKTATEHLHRNATSEVRDDLHPTLTEEIFCNSSIILGASGTPAIDRNQLITFLKNDKSLFTKYFASASSKNIEFEDVMRLFEDMLTDQNLCEEAFGSNSYITKNVISEFGLEYTVSANGKTRKFVILGEGYPIIFYPRHSHGGPIKPFDPIMTQLFIAACVLKSEYASLEKKVYSLDEMQEASKSGDPLNKLLDDKLLLQRWCELNNIDSTLYFKQIGYE